MPQPIPATPADALHAAISALQAAKGRLPALNVTDRIRLLHRAAADLQAVEEAWVAAACEAKGIPQDAPVSGEEWLGGPMVFQRNIRLLAEALAEIRDYGRPQVADDAVRVDPVTGQTVVKVFPANAFETIMFDGMSAEIWMQPEVTPDTLPDTMAVAYREGAPTTGRVALVLGAGNVSSIGPMDVLYKVFVENEVCILKMNPVNEYLGPFIEQALAGLVEADFLRVVYGGADVGQTLCNHPGVETIHMPGSDKTHAAIVWGPPGPEQEARKQSGEPVNTRPITSELGNVSPVIVVPGPWSSADMAFQAENLTTMVANNGSFNCNATKLILTHAGWDLRESFLKVVESTLAQAPRRKAYYPGAHDRYRSFLERSGARAVTAGEHTSDTIPWTFLRDVDTADRENICFTTESFCGVVADGALPGADAAEYLRNAVAFCNDTVWGTLNAAIVIHPKTVAAPGMAEALEQAIRDLRYGTVVVNHWPGLGYGLVVTTWGAWPGHSLADIQSGRGVVHNTRMFDKPQKSVIRGKFRMAPKPPWFVTNRRTHVIAPRLTRFEAAPSVWKLPGIMLNAIRG